MTLDVPTTPYERLLWAQLILAWVASTYMVPAMFSICRKVDEKTADLHTSRAAAGAGTAMMVSLALLLLGWRGWPYALGLAALSTGLVGLRWPTSQHCQKLSALLECGAVVLAVGLAAASVSGTDAEAAVVALRLPVSTDRLAAGLLMAAAIGFLGSGGTYVVRGVIESYRIEPRAPRDAEKPERGEQELDAEQYSRGRLIGSLERILLFVLVLVGAYAAAGLVLVAKGWIRSKRLEADHDFAEYFLIGTLTSLCLAVVVAVSVGAYVEAFA